MPKRVPSSTSDPIEFTQSPYARTPLWVFESGVSSKAIHLYGWLSGKYCNVHRSCWPSQQKLAADLRWEVKGIQRAIAELRKAGALVTRRRHDAAGHLTGMSYFLPMDDPRHRAVAQSDSGVVQEKSLNDSGVQPKRLQSRLSELDPRTKPNLQIETVEPPKPGKVFAGGHIREPRKIKPSLKHKDHVFCGEFIHVGKEKHREYENRLREAVGADRFSNYNMMKFYPQCEDEIASGVTDLRGIHPNLWLEKEFVQMIEDEIYDIEHPA